jgi:phage terminase Nu1 subunit (DNA packaging protein)
MKDLLTMDLAAIRAGVSISTIQRNAASGSLSVAQRGSNRQLFFDSEEVDRWMVWFHAHIKKVKESKQRQISMLCRGSGIVVSDKLSCEEEDEFDRNRLLTLARGKDKEAARKALSELYTRYNRLRLLLEEQRVGFTLGRDSMRC